MQKNKNGREVAAEVEETRVSAVSITSNQVLVAAAAVRDIFCLFAEEVFSYLYRIPFPLFC